MIKIKKQSGSALLESLIAVLIFSVGIISAMALQSKMIKNATNANLRTSASAIANERIGLIWVNQANIASFAESATDISALQPYMLPNGTRTVTITSGNNVTVRITWRAPGETNTSSYVVSTVINGG